MVKWILVLMIAGSALNGCAIRDVDRSVTVHSVDNNLRKFAYANCLFWHFSSKDYELESIRAIAGGYVETGNAPPGAYEEIAFFVKNYRIEVDTKQNIDPTLNRCFHLDNVDALNAIIAKHSNNLE